MFYVLGSSGSSWAEALRPDWLPYLTKCSGVLYWIGLLAHELWNKEFRVHLRTKASRKCQIKFQIVADQESKIQVQAQSRLRDLWEKKVQSRAMMHDSLTSSQFPQLQMIRSSELFTAKWACFVHCSPITLFLQVDLLYPLPQGHT